MAEQLRKLAELLEQAQADIARETSVKCAHILRAARGLKAIKRRMDNGVL